MNQEPVDTDAAEAPRPPADPATYELAYQEAKRALEDQESTVSETRSRAGQLIAAAGKINVMADKPTQSPPPKPQPIRPSPMITETRDGGGPREKK